VRGAAEVEWERVRRGAGQEMRWLMGWVEAGDNGFVGVVHEGGGHGLKETEAGGVIFIVVGKALSLAGSGGVNRGKRWSGSVGGSIGDHHIRPRTYELRAPPFRRRQQLVTLGARRGF
jgi:hypothetical protein